jgi:riboflavin biosynthesis pyrimidine reductase
MAWHRLAPAHLAAYIAPIMLGRLTALFALLWFGSIESTQAQSRTYPSLLRRPVESRDRDAELAKAAAAHQAVAPKALDPAVLAELGRLNMRAMVGGTAFDRSVSESDRAVAAARGTAVASESWVTAQEALSALDASRFDSVIALAGIDTIYVDQLNSGGDTSAVEGYRAPILAMVDRQNDRLDSLRSKLTLP